MSKFTEVKFKKSSFSPHGDLPGRCVEVAITDDAVGVRDSKTPDEGTLSFTKGEWDAFVLGVKAGEFDL